MRTPIFLHPWLSDAVDKIATARHTAVWSGRKTFVHSPKRGSFDKVKIALLLIGASHQTAHWLFFANDERCVVVAFEKLRHDLPTVLKIHWLEMIIPTPPMTSTSNQTVSRRGTSGWTRMTVAEIYSLYLVVQLKLIMYKYVENNLWKSWVQNFWTSERKAFGRFRFGLVWFTKKLPLFFTA